MKKVEKLSVDYVGYSVPESEDELQLELLGLETVLKSAEVRIASLKQSLHLSYMMKKAVVEDKNASNITAQTP